MDEFEVIGGRQLYQWDTDRSIEVRLCDGETVNEVHYAHAEDDIAPVVKVQDYDGRMFADIPNILLQRFGTLKVWAVVYTEDGRQTLRNAYLSVRARAKPDDYVYTETEIMDYRKVAEDLAELVQRVEEIEENGVQGGGAVASVNGKTGEVYLNAADVGALPTTGGKLTGNLTVPRLISTAADADGNIYEVQLYPTANGGLYMPLRHNGAVANAMSMSQSATTFGKPVAISSGGHGGKNAAEGRQNLSLYSKEEIDEKITNTQKEIERLTEEIGNIGNPTNEQVSEAVNAYLKENPVQPTPLDSTFTKAGHAADAAAVGKAFSDRIEGGGFDSTGNLVFEDKVTIGSYIQPDGGLIVSNAYTERYCVTDYLSVEPSTSYAMFTTTGVIFNCAQYSKDKTFIDGTVTSYPNLITTSTDCAYLVVCLRDANDAIGSGCLVVKQGDERIYEYTPPKNLPYKFVGVEYATREQVEMMAGDTDAKLNLPDKYALVVGDQFELFWSGAVISTNPECYHVDATCDKGTPYKRYFRYIPSGNDVGTHDMVVKLYNHKHDLVDEKTVQLVVKPKATSPTTKKVVMYVGDSLAAEGYIPDEVHRRLTASDGTPAGDSLANIAFIGDKRSVSHGVPYVGNGGWSFASYCNAMSSNAYMTITATGHDKTNDDQHSVYADENGVHWKVETIKTEQIDIIRISESGVLPASGVLTWVSGGVDNTPIIYSASTQAAGNPFWNNETNKTDFASFVTECGEERLDYVYVLLGWNSSYMPKVNYIGDAKWFINNLLTDYPNCKIILLGLQMPSYDGCAQNYGAKTDVLCHRHELINYVHNHGLWCAEIAESYPENVSYVNVAGQFDSENNMQTGTRQVNVRNSATETYQTNGVHPAVSGYMQIADAVYRDFTHKLQE